MGKKILFKGNFHSFLWVCDIPLCLCATSSLSIHLWQTSYPNCHRDALSPWNKYLFWKAGSDAWRCLWYRWLGKTGQHSWLDCAPCPSHAPPAKGQLKWPGWEDLRTHFNWDRAETQKMSRALLQTCGSGIHLALPLLAHDCWSCWLSGSGAGQGAATSSKASGPPGSRWVCATLLGRLIIMPFSRGRWTIAIASCPSKLKQPQERTSVPRKAPKTLKGRKLQQLLTRNHLEILLSLQRQSVSCQKTAWLKGNALSLWSSYVE